MALSVPTAGLASMLKEGTKVSETGSTLPRVRVLMVDMFSAALQRTGRSCLQKYRCLQANL